MRVITYELRTYNRAYAYLNKIYGLESSVLNLIYHETLFPLYQRFNLERDFNDL